MKQRKYGDTRDDGFRFLKYAKGNKLDGSAREQWVSPAAWMRTRVDTAWRNAKKRALDASVPFDIDVDYLLSVYPSDGLCPILKIPMIFGGEERANSPSVDRYVPEKGYTRGNLCWICTKANIIKQDITDPEVFLAVAKYVSGCTTQHTSNLNNG